MPSAGGKGGVERKGERGQGKGKGERASWGSGAGAARGEEVGTGAAAGGGRRGGSAGGWALSRAGASVCRRRPKKGRNNVLACVGGVDAEEALEGVGPILVVAAVEGGGCGPGLWLFPLHREKWGKLELLNTLRYYV